MEETDFLTVISNTKGITIDELVDSLKEDFIKTQALTYSILYDSILIGDTITESLKMVVTVNKEDIIIHKNNGGNLYPILVKLIRSKM